MKHYSIPIIIAATIFAAGGIALADDTAKPLAAVDIVFDEVDGIVSVEAEHFYKQTLTDKRAWHITSSKSSPDIKPDADQDHVAGASGGAYLELLPDTRATHSHKMIYEENFTDKPGALAIAYYKVNIQTPGRYYVWLRSFSTGSEDNGVHVGLDGQWPESGQRWQTVNKTTWAWDCSQRTEEVHTGIPMQLFLDIAKAGEHEIMFSLREDGFEIDKFVLSRNKDFRPENQGPRVKVKSGTLPAAFPEVTTAASESTPLPSQSGTPPAIQTHDLGSGTLAPLVLPRMTDGKGTVEVSGELRAWHKVTLTLDGPYAHELDNEPNPFTDINFTVTFTHESGAPIYKVPGYFATDGNASESSAEAGTKWRAHLAPDKTGTWNYTVSFTQGKHVALDGGGASVKPFDGLSGSFKIAETNKKGRDFRAHGRLQYVGKHHLQFAGSKQFFLKVGADSPETLLAYEDFDNTQALKKNVPLKTWKPHVQDFHKGDPTWKGDKGQGLIGALNYLSDNGVNSVSFLTYNAGGDGNNIWPFVERDAKLHYDCSKLDQWGIVLEHATAKGLYLHFKLQENEIDDNRRGDKGNAADVPESLDGGKLGPQRKLYCRELIARYAHNLALNWNISEESTQSTEEINDMINYIHANDPYQHLVVIHTFPNQQDKVYTPLLGEKSKLTGASLQNAWNVAHQRTLNWVTASAVAGKPWVVANDEQNGADTGVPPDIGYSNYDGKKKDGKSVQTTDDIRQLTLWGNLMAGGAGVEYYFGYQLPQNDLIAEDWRSREKSWNYGRIALDFFRDNQIPFWEMKNANALIGNTQNDNSKYCLAKAGDCYLAYLPNGGETQIDLVGVPGKFSIKWFNPREGGALKVSGRATIDGGSKAILTSPSADDWLAVITKQ